MCSVSGGLQSAKGHLILRTVWVHCAIPAGRPVCSLSLSSSRACQAQGRGLSALFCATLCLGRSVRPARASWAKPRRVAISFGGLAACLGLCCRQQRAGPLSAGEQRLTSPLSPPSSVLSLLPHVSQNLLSVPRVLSGLLKIKFVAPQKSGQCLCFFLCPVPSLP